VLSNTAPIAENLVARYARQSSAPIVFDLDSIRALGCASQRRDLLGAGPAIRHDPAKLARSIVELLPRRNG
jgi:hypothetical protein